MRVSNPANRKDLAARTWGVFWYKSKMTVLFEIMVQIKQKRGTGVESPFQEASRAVCTGLFCNSRKSRKEDSAKTLASQTEDALEDAIDDRPRMEKSHSCWPRTVDV